MSVHKAAIDNFLVLSMQHPIIDVRSPAEFAHAHIPGAYNLPLFNDEERKVVGTAYKQESREKAIKIGLRYFGPKMVEMVEAIEQFKPGGELKKAKKTLLVHCWRGGMRSAGVAWLLDLYGFKVYTLAGGYKSFRQWAHLQFDTGYQFKIIGGFTGSGKTGIIANMKNQNISAVDLEGLANHKGSAFGSIGQPPQPTQEMFENCLALALSTVGTKQQAENNEQSSPVLTLTASDQPPTINDRTVWLEDESQRIGNLMIPPPLWQQMRRAPVYFLQIPFEERLSNIIQDYGKGDKEKIINAVVRIKKKLGGLETKTAVNHLLEDNLAECFRVLLTYYDKLYQKSLHNRDGQESQVKMIKCETVNAAQNMQKLMNVETIF